MQDNALLIYGTFLEKILIFFFKGKRYGIKKEYVNLHLFFLQYGKYGTSSFSISVEYDDCFLYINWYLSLV